MTIQLRVTMHIRVIFKPRLALGSNGEKSQPDAWGINRFWIDYWAANQNLILIPILQYILPRLDNYKNELFNSLRGLPGIFSTIHFKINPHNSQPFYWYFGRNRGLMALKFHLENSHSQFHYLSSGYSSSSLLIILVMFKSRPPITSLITLYLVDVCSTHFST